MTNKHNKGTLIVTFSKNCNMGGALQEYALFAVLKNYGNVKCLDYRNDLVVSLSKPVRIGFLIKMRMMLVSVIKKLAGKNNEKSKEYRHANLLDQRLLIKEVVERLYLMISDIINYKNRKEMIKNFFKFWNSNIQYTDNYTDTQLSDKDVVDELFGEYDTCISGSDQIWNPVYMGISPYYFLSFVPTEVKKASFASSFGNYKFSNDSINKRIGGYLSTFDHVGVRESYSVSHLMEKCNIAAECVLDPTLLLTKKEWCNNLNVQRSGSSPFLLVYALGNRREILPFAERVGQHLNLKVIVLDTKFIFSINKSKFEYMPSVGPGEFIQLFSEAKFVITNSFHGTAFSVNFNVPFFSVTSRTGERAKSFLDMVGLSDRLVYDCKSCDLERTEIDFVRANQMLELERSKSTEYLDKVMNRDDDVAGA